MEKKVLALLSRLSIEDNVVPIMKIIKNIEDWDSLLDQARKQRIDQLLFPHFSEISEKHKIQIPNDIMNKVQDIYGKLSKDNSKKFLEFDNINQMFIKNNIKCVVLKGPALVGTIYSIGERRFADFDLLFDTKDILKAHKILEECGYIAKNSENSNSNCVISEKDITNAAASQFHLFEYFNPDKKYMYIEMHHTFISETSSNNFREFYDSSIKNERGWYIPNLIDLFIHSCTHTYRHHLLHMEALRRQGDRLSLYMDVRECYIKLQKLNMIDRTINRCKELNCLNIVSNILSLANYLLGDIDIDKRFYENVTVVSWDWKSNYFCSTYEARLFSPLEEHERIQNLYINLKEDSKINNEFKCYKNNKSKSDPEFWKDIKEYIFYAEKGGNNHFWGDHIYFRNFLDNDEVKSNFKICYDESNFYFKLKTENANYVPKGHAKGYSQDETTITLFFSNNKDDIPFVLYTIINQGNSRIFSNATSKGNIVDGRHGGFEVVKDAKIQTEIKEGRFEIEILIPWESIDMHLYKSFLFDFTTKLIKDGKRQIISWNAGKGANHSNSLWLSKIDLI